MMKKKKILIILFVVIFLLILGFISFKINQKEKKEILLFNWGEYIDPQLIDAYNQQSEKFVIKQSFFSSNELAINKIQTGHQYDIAILSEYAIMQLKPDYLQKIESEFNVKPKFNEQFEEIKFKLNNDEYSIPYFWGKLGILYNKKKIKQQLLEDNWINLLKNSKYKVALYNNPFEGIFLGLKATCGDISGSNEIDNQKAKEWLLDLKKTNTNLSFVTDQLLDNMKIKDEEHYDLALAYSGDARFLMKNNENLAFFDFASGGTNIWVDSFVLPKGSNIEGAYDFINFLLKPENIQKNTSFVDYDSPYQIDNIDNKFVVLKAMYNDKFYQYDEQCKKQINDIWNEVYASPRPKDYYLFIFSFLIVFIFIIIRFFNLHSIKQYYN
ncbi:spermidine/putrescine ABC transporter substrate-binding protein [Candidatus Phytoplasma phoenicium]|uniref:Spermidine/putrescine ABC transporter substrate-binding protein n=1 Tax=Candidatus Phytoplasma phoenicium TaxID=198422 RepID=A0A2S8NVL4_9MOLU|nr:spermidine/putrescine ABC transporter substrate-binding protein [Candidatus Phytoplasma phoenicium]